MTVTPASEVTLDPRVVERLAILICGDDTPHRRSTRELEAFFEAAGWTWVDEFDASSRFAWVSECVMERRRDVTAVRQLLLRIADPREYLGEVGEAAAVLQELNSVLELEGVEVAIVSGRPVLQERSQSDPQSRLDGKIPLELTADLSAVVRDEAFGQQLKARLAEARVCYEQDAPVATVIMLGSVLEGVLYAVATDRSAPGRRPPDRLEALIDFAGEQKWVTPDVVDYAHVVRNHRNLVHPKKQKDQGYAPDKDIARIAWNVVVAALNCIAALAPPEGRSPSPQGDPAQGEPTGGGSVARESAGRGSVARESAARESAARRSGGGGSGGPRPRPGPSPRLRRAGPPTG